MQAGDTFFIHGLDDDHLWMIISDPHLHSESVVVCFLSVTPWMNAPFVVRCGEHPFVKHDTCVNFAGARAVRLEKLRELKKGGQLKPNQPLSSELLSRIRVAAEASDIPLRCYEILRAQGFVD